MAFGDNGLDKTSDARDGEAGVMESRIAASTCISSCSNNALAAAAWLDPATLYGIFTTRYTSKCSSEHQCVGLVHGRRSWMLFEMEYRKKRTLAVMWSRSRAEIWNELYKD